MNQQYPSVLLEKAVGEFSKLPGIGRKTAMRLVLHLLRQETATVEAFGNSIITLKREVKYCKVCHNISDTETCQICANPQRDASTVCVGENIRVFRSEIPFSVRAAECSLSGESIFSHDRDGKVAAAYEALTKEVTDLEERAKNRSGPDRVR